MDWGGDGWSAEGTPRRCFHASGIASRGLQYDISGVVHSRSRSWELLEQAFDDGYNHVHMRNLLVWFFICSGFYLIFAFEINLSPILLPLLCMPLGFRLFVCVAASVKWKVPAEKNYGDFTYVLRQLTKYSWRIRQLSSASIILSL